MHQSEEALPTQQEVQQARKTLEQLRYFVGQIKDAAAPEHEGVVQVPDAAVDAATEAGSGCGTAPPKKRMALFLAYNGHGFSGMQLNPGVPTIEACLRDALVATGAMLEGNRHNLGAVRWSRSARTDKGVSALGQVISAKLMATLDLPQRIQNHLPSKIRVLGAKKVTASFDARTHCDSRIYEYCLPEWVFDPDCFPSKPGWRPPSYPTNAAVERPGIGEVSGGSSAGAHDGAVELLLRQGYSEARPPEGSTFQFGEDCLARLNDILQQYEGCHNFHNFSPGVQPEQMSALRNILSFRCDGVFTISSRTNAARWVRMRVHGQSFLLHQIRKLVGMAVACYRGTAPEGAISMALDPCRDFSTPMAPELGLFLVECKYTAYNERFGKEREMLDVSEWANQIEAFKQEQIYPAMLARDDVEAVNYQWLRSVTDESFLFSSWHTAQPMRKLKRPRKRAGDTLEDMAPA